MNKLKRFFQNLNHRHYVCMALTLGFALLGAFVYTQSYIRFGETVRDVVFSILYYYKTIFGIPGNLTATVVNDSNVIFPIKEGFTAFSESFKAYWVRFADFNNFEGYLDIIFSIIFFGSAFGGVFVGLGVALYEIFKVEFYKPNTDYGKDSKPLARYKAILEHVYYPVKNYIRSYGDFLARYKWYLYIWLAVWIVNLNVAQVALAVVAYIFYFACTFDVVSIFRQLYKLALDLSLMFEGLPVIGWIAIAIVLFNAWRKDRADKVLHRLDRLNKSFVDSLPICTFTNGAMGKGKNLLSTSFALDCNANFREKAYDILYKCDMSFPDFPWVELEQMLIRKINSGEIFNLASSAKYVPNYISLLDPGFVKRCVDRYNRRHPDRTVTIELLPEYPYHLPETYDNGCKVLPFYDVVETYSKAFFIYYSENFNISNYAIRLDDILESEGNFPLWNNDSIRRPSYNEFDGGKFCKNLDFDITRLNKRVVENNPLANTFEFGVVNITEIGKERLNQLEGQGVRKDSDSANQKNDGFNSFLKLIRHSSTVDFYPFAKVFSDDQRNMSLNADCKEVCTLVEIEDRLPERYVLPFGLLETDICSWILNKFSDVYYKYRYFRGDNTLTMYLLKHIVKLCFDRKERIVNKYGVSEFELELESGVLDGRRTSASYYILNKVAYADRYSTDCYSGYFQTRALKSGKGLKDYKSYAGVKATFKEMQAQNSYVVKSLLEDKKDNTEQELDKGFEKWLKGLYKADVKRKATADKKDEENFNAWREGYEKGYKEGRKK